MLDRRTKRIQRVWQAGRPAVSSADRGLTAPTGPGTLSMLASGPTTVWSVQVTNTQIVMTILCLVPGIVGQSKKLLKYTKLRVDRANSVTQQRQSGDWHLNYSDSSTPRINTSSLQPWNVMTGARPQDTASVLCHGLVIFSSVDVEFPLYNSSHLWMNDCVLCNALQQV